MSGKDIRIFYRGEFFWGGCLKQFIPGLFGWFVNMPDGGYSDYEGTYPTFREFGPFVTLREAYDYAVPPESEGQW